ncbi:hypothetical protein K450DRAFT_257823 [Umbelopsis ramanniana AG]|uniref:50S ribosomal protein L9, chloroplastic n=1 Tax=Umbelopsis ramanniana AG TaxID=1314678 RepID=A0AAD5E331_UMBRA|nr:uncharacterized protein K450DRAFT_257823 [Umbelopsis ramanniana AG]KAI8576248.1 hypothetical protein K450DRAFT_257823 [Umbelopsis ramanniana AG]
MSFTSLVTKAVTRQPTLIFKRNAHKKASINVKLNTYIEGLGLKDEVVTVRPGLMRNVLLPSKQASYINKFNGPRDRNAVLAEPVVQKMVDPSIGIKRQDTAARKLFAELAALPGPLEFVRAVIPDTTATFGSVTSEDIAEKLSEYEVTLDKRLVLSEKIKSLGQHQVSIKCGESQVNIDVIVKSP